MADFVAWRRGDIKAITLQKQLSTIRMALRYWADIEGVEDGLTEKVYEPAMPSGIGRSTFRSRPLEFRADVVTLAE